jgi:iron complex outermembrane recepter protein
VRNFRLLRLVMIIFALVGTVIRPGSANEAMQGTSHQVKSKVQDRQFLTHAADLLAQDTRSTPVKITGIQLVPTNNGIEVVLETQGSGPSPLTKTEGNQWIAEIENAVLLLPEGDSFQQINPAPGITTVIVRQGTNQTVQVMVTGEMQIPVASVRFTEAIASGPPAAPDTTQPGVDPEDGEEELVVTGEQETGYSTTNATAATKTDTPLRDIPQSIQVVPRQVIEDQKITDIIDAAKNVSGVINRAGFGGVADDYNIRGFDNFDKLRDGFVSSFSEVAPNNIERVEVLKGPASVLYGQFEPGGIINYVTKQPLDQPYYAADLTVGSYAFYEPSFDISGPLTQDKRLKYRLNASYRNSGSFVDFVDREVVQIAPTLTYQIAKNTKLNFSYEYIRSDGTFYDGLPVDPVLFQLPRDRFIGEPSNFLKQETNTINLTLDHKFSKNWEIRSGFSAQLFNLNMSAFRPSSVEPDGQTLNRFFQADILYDFNTYTFQTDVMGRFKTGPIQHQILFGINLQRQTFDDYQLYATAPSIDLFNPVYDASTPTVFDDGPLRSKSLRNTVGLYLQDQITLLPNLKLLVGGRYDFITQTNKDVFFDIDGVTPLGPPETSTNNSQAFSPRVGLVYQPIEPVSLYASFSQSFVPSFSRDRNNDFLPPSRGTQYEVGVRAEFLDRKVTANLAAYEITKTNVAVTDPLDPAFSIATGEVKSRGIEFDISGEPLPGWNIIASAYLNDAFVSKDTDPANVGQRFINAPSQGASLWSTYEIQKGPAKGLGFGAGVFFVGDREVELPNTFVLPSYVRVDATIFYRRKNWRVGLNFKNLFDKTYYEYQGVGIQVGDPFTILGTVSVEF